MITNPRPSNHDSAERSKQVMIRRFTPDWDFLAETTNARMHGVLEKRLPGSWYLNPRYTVHAEEPTREFLRKARKCQADWFRMMDESLLSATRRRTQRNTNNERERHLGFSGILIVDGKLLDPHAWYVLEAGCGMHPESEVVTSHRPINLQEFLPDRVEALKQFTRTNLEKYLTHDPLDPLYVTPGLTVTSTVYNEGFRAAVIKHSGQWHRKLDRALGPRQWRALARQSDLATRMLVFHGVLVIAGVFYKPGCWPKCGNNADSVPVNPRTSTVPPEALGITIP